MSKEPVFLTEGELSKRLKIPVASLQWSRSRPTDDTIPYIKLGRRVRYDWAAVQAYLKARTHHAPGAKEG